MDWNNITFTGTSIINRYYNRMKEPLNWSDFAKVDMRIGTVTHAEVFKEVKNPAYKLKIDFCDVPTVLFSINS